MKETLKVVKTEPNSASFCGGGGVEDANPSSNNSSRRMKVMMRSNGGGGQDGTVEGHTPSAATAKMLSSLTVEKYILQLHQKEEKIRTLEEENKLLRSTLIAKTNEYKIRVDELVMELERHADLVVKLQNELVNCRKHTIPAALAKEPPTKKVRRVAPQTVPTIATSIVGATSKSRHHHNQKAAQIQGTNAADDIFTKLQHFVEKNSQQEQQMDQAQSADEFMPEQIFKTMAENPNLLQAFLQVATAAAAGGGDGEVEEQEEGGGGGEGEKAVDPANLLALLIDPSSASDFMNEPREGRPSQQRNERQKCEDIGQQDQQNLDFEEVMQRVIGEAMSSSNNNTDNNPSPMPAMVATNGGGSRGNRTKGGGGGGISSLPIGTSGKGGGKQKGGGGTTTTIVPASIGGTPLALPKGGGGGTATGNKKSGNEAKNGASSTPANASTMHLPSHHHPSSATAKPFTTEEQKLVNELEARIDENILRLGLCPLNTAELAVQCTRLMREYSIGQRLFARTVMCKVSQSQGSLSELLSKPRPWHKLTDKGRDAFRRIFGWISDDEAIELLCQLSPRKVTITEKIVHPNPATLLEPLEEVEAAEIMESSGKKGSRQAHHSSSGHFEHSPKSIKSEKIEQQIAAELAKSKEQMLANGASSLVNGPGGRWRHDDIPKEKIIAIHEAEKAKLMEQESKIMVGIVAASAESSRMGSLSPTPRRGSSQLPGGVLNKVRQASKALGGLEELIGRSPSANSSTTMGSEGVADTNIVPSSLLFGQPQQRSSISAAGGTRLEPFPIAQSQIEHYTSLDTEEVVRQIKEFLAKNAVSQRQFGEGVLGLSQGSVSDLLARPKAWNLLTPKGREPFVRMQIFLEQYRAQMEEEGDEKGKEEEDEEGNGEGGLKIEEEEEGKEEDSGEELELKLELPVTDSSSYPASMAPEDEEEQLEMDQNDEERSEIDDLAAAATNEDSEKLLQTILAQIKYGQSNGDEASETVVENKPTMKAKNEGVAGTGHQPKTTTRQNGSQQTNETAALDEIDTADVARRVKECLSKSGISQRAFGEHILKMTSGCVSDLLTKPKPWVMLSWKQRQSYQKMLDFLTDSGSVERLRADEQHRCEMNNALNALKAIASSATNASTTTTATTVDKSGLVGLTALVEQHSPGVSPAPTISNRSSASSTLQIVTNLACELGANTPIGTILKKANSPKPTAVNVQQNGRVVGTKRKAPSHSIANGTPISMVGIDANELGLGGPIKKIPRFQRTLITEKQKEALLFIFAHEQRPNSRCIEQLAAKIGLTPRTVTNWFHNHRTRQKAKEIKHEGDEMPITQSSAAIIPPTPTPAQVLARALNATDAKTANWFRELAELLRRHSDANIDMDSIGTRGSMGTASAESSPPSPQRNSNDEDGLCCILDEEEEEEGDGERGQSCGASSSASASSPLQHQHQTGGGGSQLDKVIARMHSRLAATSRVQ